MHTCNMRSVTRHLDIASRKYISEVLHNHIMNNYVYVFYRTIQAAALEPGSTLADVASKAIDEYLLQVPKILLEEAQAIREERAKKSAS